MGDQAAVPPDVSPDDEHLDPPNPPLDIDYDLLPAFSVGPWEPVSFRYGLIGLLRCREAMMPIEKPPEMVHLKFLVGSFDDRGDAEQEMTADFPDHPPARGGGGGDRKGRGKGKDKGQKGGGRYIPDMGKTEVMPGFQRGQWWRNVAADKLDVIVREQFSLASPPAWKVPHGHYVQQSGPCEVFISGQATGLQRMPVVPRGWVTVDASAVGGPKYLEKVKTPRWQIIFASGSNKGDIVVRESVSLESEEVAVLLCGTFVEQSGPQHILADGIIRMPVIFDGSATGRGTTGSRSGWVTCDASSQGGPKFFEPCPEEQQAPPPPVEKPRAPPQQAQAEEEGGGQADRAGGTWDKNRVWKVMNLGEASDGKQLPIVTRPEPYAPGYGKSPPDDIVIRWLQDGDQVEQIGHSKKMRGYMVMPVRLLPSANGGNADAAGEEAEKVDGWVTRRSLDKMKDHPDTAWFEELRGGDGDDGRQRRRSRRREPDAPHLD